MENIVLDAIKGKRLERVPVAPLINVAHASRIYGIKPIEYVLDNKKYAEAQIYTKEFYGYDWVWAHQPFQGVTEEERENVLFQEDNAILSLEMGTKLKFSPNNPPQIVENALPSKDQINELKLPDLIKEERLEPLRIMLEKEDFVCGNARCPFTFASSFLYDLESFLIDLKTDEDFVFKLLDLALEYSVELGKIQIKEGVKALFIEDPAASTSLLSPADYKKFALPYEKRLIKELGQVPIIMHICGDITPIVDDMLTARSDCISVDETVDLKRLHGKTPVWGNVAPALLVRGNKEEVHKASENVIELKSKVVLSSGCIVPGNAKEENIREMVNASKNM